MQFCYLLYVGDHVTVVIQVSHHLKSVFPTRDVVARTACPAPAAFTRHLMPTVRAGINVSILPWLYRNKRAADFIQRCSGDMCNPESDSIVTMLGVAAAISIQPVAHMHQLFGNHDFQ